MNPIEFPESEIFHWQNIITERKGKIMNPIEFPEQNTVFAKNQPEYLPLPSHKTKDGIVISCWKLNWRERLHILFTGKIWWSVLTFNQPLQPQLPQVNNPFRKTVSEEEQLVTGV